MQAKGNENIRDLASPERIQALVQTAEAFSCDDLGNTVDGASVGARDLGLHSDLDSLKGAEGNVGK